MNGIDLLSAMLLILSLMMIGGATILFWGRFRGKIGQYSRKLSYFFGIVGWGLYFIAVMPVL